MLDRVGLANRASASLIADKIGKSEPKFQIVVSGTPWTIEIKRSDELTAELKKQCVNIFESNMKQIYINSSQGYKSKEKKRELFHKHSRFLLLFSSPIQKEKDEPGRSPSSSQASLEGFLMWRFDFEETLNSEDVEVAYCYEIQLQAASTGKGLGRSLMEILEQIGTSWSMKKVMLTVHVENTKAIKFYESLRFCPDEISPCQSVTPEAEDYKILSKSLIALQPDHL